MKLGVYVYALASVAAGIINLVWRDFTTDQQPIQAFADHVPGREVYALISALLLLLGGAAMLRRSTTALGALILSVVYFIFSTFWMYRFYNGLRILGWHTDLDFGILVGIGEQLILVTAAAIVYSSRAGHAARIVFGLCCVTFGIGHFSSLSVVAAMIPSWFPPSGIFWAILTGSAFVLAGVSFLTGLADVLAARLLALMLLVFSVFALSPMILANQHDQEAWGDNAYNLAAVGAALILSEWLARSNQVPAPPPA